MQLTEDHASKGQTPQARVAEASSASARKSTQTCLDTETSQFAHGLKPSSHRQFLGMLNWNSSMLRTPGAVRK